MSSSREDVEKIISAVPGFHENWKKFLRHWAEEASPPWYLAMADLAHYIVENYAQGTTTEFTDLFAAIENLLQDPSPGLENLITVGLFEDIQNISSHRNFGFAVFRQWLGPRSLVIWDDVDAFVERVSKWTRQQQPRWWQFWRRRKKFDAEGALRRVENPELRKIIESNYRRDQ
jgi:hypothetical protein